MAAFCLYMYLFSFFYFKSILGVILLKFIILFFLILFLILIILDRKLYNPYKLYIIVGNKGTGKSAYMTSLAYKYNKKGYNVYTNYGIFNELKNNYYDYEYPVNSVLFVDETGLIHDNRNFKSFPPACTEFYKYQRKNKLIIYLASQTIDVDKKIRDLADYHILLVLPLYCWGIPFGKVEICKQIS